MMCPLQPRLAACESALEEAARVSRASDFLDRYLFLDSIEGWEKSTWVQLLVLLSQIDFNQPGPHKVRLRVPTETLGHELGPLHFPVGSKREFRISPRLIAGWKALGLIDEFGRFDFSVEKSEISKNFERAVGRSLVFLDDSDIMPHQRFVKDALNGTFYVEEVHDLLFHAAWLTAEPINIRLFEVVARFDLLFDIEEGEMSSLNSVFEGEFMMGSSDLLATPLQLMNNSLRWNFGERLYALEYYGTRLSLDSPREFIRQRQRNQRFYQPTKRADFAIETLYQVWWLVLARLELETGYRAKMNTIGVENLATALRLYEDIKALRHELENTPEFKVKPTKSF